MVWYNRPADLWASAQFLPVRGDKEKSADAIMRSGIVLALALYAAGGSLSQFLVVLAAVVFASYVVGTGMLGGERDGFFVFNNTDGEGTNWAEQAKVDAAGVALKLFKMSPEDASRILEEMPGVDEDLTTQVDTELQALNEGGADAPEVPTGEGKESYHVLPYMTRVSDADKAKQLLDDGLYKGLRTDPAKEADSFVSQMYSSPSTWGMERQFQAVERTDPQSVANARNAYAQKFMSTMQFQKDRYTPQHQPQRMMYRGGGGAAHGFTDFPRDMGSSPSLDPNANMNTTVLREMYGMA